MNVALDHRRHFRFLHAGLDVGARIFHAQGRQLVGQAHALDFLRRLDHPGLRQQWCGVYYLSRSAAESVEVALPINRRLSHHAVADLRGLRKLDAHAPGKVFFAKNFNGHLQRAHHRRPRVGGMVETERTHILCPGTAFGFFVLRLDRQQHRLTFARENNQVVSFHAPIIGEVENIVGRASDDSVKVLLAHQQANTVELALVNWMCHANVPVGRVMQMGHEPR